MTAKLRTVTRTQGNNRALKEGAVKPGSFELEIEEVPVLVQAFRRMVRGLEFDVCEMAFTTYLCAKAHGKAFTALPVFLVRGFHHGAMACSVAGPVGRPKELEGRRVGVNRGYTVTTGVWARGILSEEHGVDLDRITWVRSGDEHVAEYRPPANVESAPEGADLMEMVLAGDLAAVVGAGPDRAGLVPLLEDPAEAGLRALARRGLYPINHLVVVRDDILQAYPEVAVELFEAFARSKRLYVQALREGLTEEATPTDRMYRRVMELTASDPLPYGVEPNRKMIEELIRHALRQRILDQPPTLQTLFVPGTLDLVG